MIFWHPLMLKVKVRHFLHEMVLDLLHPILYFLIGDQILRLLKMVPNDYPWPKTLDLSPKKHSLPCSEPKLQFHAVKLSLVSYSTSTLFLTSRSNDSPNPKTLVWYQNYVSSTIRTKVTISLHEVVLGLLQTLHPVLGLQIDLRLLRMVSNDSPYPKTFSLIPKLFL